MVSYRILSDLTTIYSHLKLDLSPNVNFLVGNNGSTRFFRCPLPVFGSCSGPVFLPVFGFNLSLGGKSAVLVGLVTCLGAAARFSNRSSKIGDLVRNAINSAKCK